MKIHLLQKQLTQKHCWRSDCVDHSCRFRFSAFTFQPSALPTDPASCRFFCPFKCLKRHQHSQPHGVIGNVKNLKVGAGKPGELDLVPMAPKEEL